MFKAVRGWVGRVGAVVLADYGKGVLTPDMVARVTGIAGAAGVPVFVDPKSPDFSHYRGATCITPNLKELSAAAAGAPVADEAAVVAAARRVLRDADAGAVLVTRSEKGMTLVESSGAVHTVPARARAVFDVSGAGDTVIAAMALCAAAGRTLAQAMHVAQRRRERRRQQARHRHRQRSGGHARAGRPGPRAGRTRRRPAAPAAPSRCRRCRTWSPAGRPRAFRSASPMAASTSSTPAMFPCWPKRGARCDRLVVALNTDASVSRLKGPERPVNTLDSRARVVAALRHVDCVVAFDQPTPLALIQALLPDVLVKGADYTVDQVVGADVVRAAGGQVVLASLVPGQSTTGIVAKLRRTVPAA